MACSSDQLCAGLSSDIVGAINAMSSLFMDHRGSDSGWGFLWWMRLMDLTHCMNHTAMLLHTCVL